MEGEVLIGARSPFVLAGYALVATVLLGLFLVCTITYTRSESVPGWVVPEGGLTRLTAPSGAVVEKVYVSEGDFVQSGQPLVRVKLSRDTASGDSGKMLVFSAERELEGNRANALATESKIRTDQAALIGQRTSSVRQLQDARSTLLVLESKRRLAADALARAEELRAQGYLTQTALDSARASALDASQGIISQRMAIETAAQAIRDLDNKIAQGPILLAQADATARSAEASLAQKVDEAKISAGYVVTAPRSGTVMALPYAAGQAIDDGASVVALAPSVGPLEIELFVPSRASGFIQVGQDVALQYQPYPYEVFGSGRARIVSMSRTPLTPSDVAGLGLTLNEPAFRVRCRLFSPYVSAYGKRYALRPGTALTGLIILDRRSLLAWLFEPFLAVGKRP